MFCLIATTCLSSQAANAKVSTDLPQDHRPQEQLLAPIQQLQKNTDQKNTDQKNDDQVNSDQVNSDQVNSDDFRLAINGNLQTHTLPLVANPITSDLSTYRNDNSLGTISSGSVASNSNSPTTIDGLSFNGYGQLVIQASRAISYRGSLNLATNTFTVTIPATRISPQLRRPILGSNSPIEQIRLNQVGDAVVISVKTIAGWQIREAIRTDPQAIALQLNSVGQVTTSNVPITRAQAQNTYSNVNGRQIVVIDPGHGGPDVGATRNGVYEKDITLVISKQLGRILQQMGYSVVFTRTEDIDLDLDPRVKIAENARASAFVSVHVNSLDANASQVSGVETYHAPGASLGENLAELVHEQILAITGANDRGVRSARFYVIRNTSMPAILVETGYITNPTEASKLVNSAYQQRMAEAIAKGVDQFLKSYRR
ncbi:MULTISPECIES: N-acetylmuramoyl-L-alanine amidase family protein [Pseudanabaena]|uniref:Cell wall hydrolase/autolysin n=2 Tax=Pseudanabaena TaxID=1152 RepID=L8MZY2_9CYAN|nr:MULTISPECIES: N-acetylmuramoyl-L-alanine amidase [Pseudanabaena]ELS32309.1 cell wall hydrolase/autolysin [Pseudanabaena biceps PCC 7429]MDG3495454.1 N-acetylmuramoyl-L-alanine amidase [Pseudanabaena catenata USMAC16]